MPRSYRHIQEYEREIMELRSNGKTVREICEIFGFLLKIKYYTIKGWDVPNRTHIC